MKGKSSEGRGFMPKNGEVKERGADWSWGGHGPCKRNKSNQCSKLKLTPGRLLLTGLRQISELNCKDPMFILSAAPRVLKRTR